MVLTLLAACGGQLGDPEAERSDPFVSGSVIPPPPVRQYQPPDFTSRDRFFPELERASSSIHEHVEGAAPTAYSFETCQEVDFDFKVDAKRVYLKDLGRLGSMLTQSDRRYQGAPCPGDDCYLELIGANIGESITIDEDGIVSCETWARSDGFSRCKVTARWRGLRVRDADHLPATKRRGFIVVADDITFSGDIALGGQVLVVIARDEVRFDEAHIDGRWLTAGYQPWELDKPAPFANVTLETGPGLQWLHGRGGTYEPANVMIVAERVTGRGTVDLRGVDGTDGVDAIVSGCVLTPGTWGGCHGRPRPDPGHGGNGADGSPGGRIRFYAGSVSDDIDFLRTAASGGRGGRGRDGGRNGTDGRNGRRGRVVKNNKVNRAQLTFGLAERLAKTTMINARHYFRGGDEPRADYLLGQMIRYFCTHDDAARRAWDVQWETRRRWQIACDEARKLRARLTAGNDWFGLAQGDYLYVDPRGVKTIRDAVHGELDEIADPDDASSRFWSLIIRASERNLTNEERREETQLALAGQETVTEQAKLAKAVAAEKVVQAGKKMKRVQQAIQENHASIAGLNDLVPHYSRDLDRYLEAAPCLLDCVVTWVVRGIQLAQVFAGNLSSVDYGALVELSDGDLRDELEDGNNISTEEAQLRGLIELGEDIWSKGRICTAHEEMQGACNEGTGFEDIFDAARAVADLSPSEFDRIDPKEVGDRRYDLLGIAAKNRQIAEDARRALGDLHSAIHRVESADPDDIRNKSEALATLDRIADVYQRIQVLADETRNLAREFADASADVLVAGMEYDLASARHEGAKRREDYFRCRMGERTRHGTSCNGIGEIGDAEAEAHARSLIDATCRQAMALNERVLLMDALYYRARNYMSLWQPGDAQTPRHAGSSDYSRVLFTPEGNDEYRADANEDLDTFLEDLQRRHGLRSTALVSTMCRADALELGVQVDDRDACEPDLQAPVRNAYSDRLLRSLLRDGRATLEISPQCSAEIPPEEQACHTDFEQRAEALQRVGKIDARFIMDGTYRLPRNLTWRADVSHGIDNAYDFADGSRRTYRFDPRAPERVCSAVIALTGADPAICSSLVAFSGTIARNERDPQSHELASTLDRDFVQELDTSPFFGASVRGEWTIDIRPMLRSMNATDRCYELDSGEVRESCLPDICAQDHAPGFCFDLTQICAPHFSGVGTLSKDSEVPTACEQICGPKCRDFKSKLRGLHFQVQYWHEN